MVIISDESNKHKISRGVASGNLKKIAPKIYITANTNNDARQISDGLFKILNAIAPNGVIAYKSALPSSERTINEITVLGDSNKKINLGGILTLVILEDKQKIRDLPTLQSIARSGTSEYRKVLDTYAVLQSFSKSIPKKYCDPSYAQQIVEDKILRLNGDHEKIEAIRNEYMRIGKIAGMVDEVKKILKVIDEAERMFNEKYGKHIDYARVVLFNKLYKALIENEYLSNLSNKLLLTTEMSNTVMEHTAFFESYFSNYIEGTKFAEEEARAIVFGNNFPYERHSDGHDLISLYRLALIHEMSPKNIVDKDDFLVSLKEWHKYFLGHAVDKHPGEFKSRRNIAGSTTFVDPDRVEKMLMYVFEIGQTIEDPLKKAIFLSLAFTEVHPFDDGNGRISRLLMNMVLSANNMKRIIFPTVFRQDYNLNLKAFSQREEMSGIVKFVEHLVDANLEINYACSLDETVEFLKSRKAFDEDDMAKWKSEAPIRDGMQVEIVDVNYFIGNVD